MAETHDPCPRNSQPREAGKGKAAVQPREAGKGEAAVQQEQFGVTISELGEPFPGFST